MCGPAPPFCARGLAPVFKKNERTFCVSSAKFSSLFFHAWKWTHQVLLNLHSHIGRWDVLRQRAFSPLADVYFNIFSRIYANCFSVDMNLRKNIYGATMNELYTWSLKVNINCQAEIALQHWTSQKCRFFVFYCKALGWTLSSCLARI